MRKLIALLAVCLLLITPALAQDTGFDVMRLTETEGVTGVLDENGVDTVYRFADQPFEGEMEAEDMEAFAFADFVTLANEGCTVIRLTFSMICPTRLAASALTITADNKDWRFTVEPITAEYDTVYYEDYAFYLTEESLPMLRAMARSQTEGIPFSLEGAYTAHGILRLSGEAAAAIYDLYVDCGGTAQDLSLLSELSPVKIAPRDKAS